MQRKSSSKHLFSGAFAVRVRGCVHVSIVSSGGSVGVLFEGLVKLVFDHISVVNLVSSA